MASIKLPPGLIRGAVLALAVLAITVLGACEKKPERLNLVLITVDTLRADHLTPYGYRVNTSPFLQDLSESSFLFEDAIAQCGTTQQSLSALMTGLYPYTDQIIVPNGPFMFLKKENHTLAKILREKEYRTHAITSSIQSAPVTGINLGFETFDAIQVGEGRKKPKRRIAEEVTRLAVEWLKNKDHDNRPFFLWLHYLDPHYPYAAPVAYDDYFSDPDDPQAGETKHYKFDERHSDSYPLTDGELEELVTNYDREIRYTDESIRDLFQSGLMEFLDDTIVIFTSDHGEALGNHQIITHNELYQTIIHVPLFIRLPGQKPPKGVIKDPVMLVDLFPTILDLLKVNLEMPLRGTSLEPFLHSNAEDFTKRFRLAEYDDRQALYHDQMKLIIRESMNELYNFKEDRYEHHNLYGSLQDYQDRLVEESLRLRKESHLFSRSTPTGLPKVTPEMIEELKALGYVAE